MGQTLIATDCKDTVVGHSWFLQ